MTVLTMAQKPYFQKHSAIPILLLIIGTQTLGKTQRVCPAGGVAEAPLTVISGCSPMSMTSVVERRLKFSDEGGRIF